MAMRTRKSTELLDPALARAAGTASVLFAVLGAAALIVFLATESQPAGLLACLIVLAAVLVAAAGVGVQLVLRQAWAQRVLLVFWVIAAAVGVGAALAALLWGKPGWWGWIFPLEAVIGAGLGGSCVAVVLTVLASAPTSRLRYASMVTVSVAAAAALAVAANMVAHTDSVRIDIETLGRWGLSDRAKAVLEDVDKPIRLTCVYPGEAEGLGKEQAELQARRRARVWELLGEMRQRNRRIEIDNVLTDRDKARLAMRLRKQFGGEATGHVALLNAFRQQAKDLLGKLRQQRSTWSAGLEHGYLAHYGVPVRIARTLRGLEENLRSTAGKIDRQMEGVPDYGQLTKDLVAVLEQVQKNIEVESEILRRIGELPAAAKKAKAKMAEHFDAAIATARKMLQAIGTPSDPEPTAPAETLKQIAEAAGETVEQLRTTAEALQNLAGAENADLLMAHDAWYADIGVGGLVLRATVPQVLAIYAGKLDEGLRAESRRLIAQANVQHQRDEIVELRKNAVPFDKILQQLKDKADKALTAIASADAHPRELEILERAGGGKAFQDILQPVAELLAEAAKLPKLEATTLPEEIQRDNIVIIEVQADKPRLEVVGFEDLWPLRADWAGGVGGQERSRVFNGGAISSRILKMTHEPFAAVLVTYLDPGPQLRQSADSPVPENYRALKKCLEDANFKVETWNLDDPMPDGSDEQAGGKPEGEAAGARGLQKVLLVLPPPLTTRPSQYAPPTPRFDEQHVQKIREQIDGGTPAVFLVGFARPLTGHYLLLLEPRHDVLNDYLRKDWGIDVKADYRVIAAGRVSGEAEPGKYSINLARWGYAPLSAFTDHPIGRPLQGSRVFWNDLCPVLPGSAAPKTNIQAVLEVPEYATDTWATGDFAAVIQKLMPGEDGLVAPAAGDLLAPFPVAMAAARSADGEVKAARIAVLAMAGSLQDQYLDVGVPQMTGEGNIRWTDPPKANADVVINSIYWLIGRQGYIAAGPVQIRPVANMSKNTQTIIQALFVAALPAAVLCIGAVVLMIRRR